MKLKWGLLDYSQRWSFPNVYLFTGNTVVKPDGALVMGRGAARQVRDSYTDIDKVFGRLINNAPHASLLWHTVRELQYLGWFKVKINYKDAADPHLITKSMYTLRTVAAKNPRVFYHMNFPGVGNGGLDPFSVAPVVRQLPDNVTLYMLKGSV